MSLRLYDDLCDKMKELLKGLTLSAFLAVITTLGFFSLIGVIILKPVPQESRDIVFAMVGSIATAWISIISFHFGSSSTEVDRSKKFAERIERDSMRNGAIHKDRERE